MDMRKPVRASVEWATPAEMGLGLQGAAMPPAMRETLVG
jgi:hypothetical protein